MRLAFQSYGRGLGAGASLPLRASAVRASHYRGGTECALCADCPRYRSADGLFRTLAARLMRRSRV
jgi:hypothetical protein